MRIHYALFTLGVAAAGCHIKSATDSLRDSIDDARFEGRDYLANARTIDTMPSMLDEVDHHSDRMYEIIIDMGVQMEFMHDCAGIGGMMDVRQDIRREVDAHTHDMHAFVNVATALDEVRSHVSTVELMLDDLDDKVMRSHCSR